MGGQVDRLDESARFRRLSSPTTQELTQLARTIARWVGRYLEHQGLLERDAENSYRASDAVAGGPLDRLMDLSITCRIAVGLQAGRKVLANTMTALNFIFMSN